MPEKKQSSPADQQQVPQWKQDFPIKWEEDHYVARREFTKFMVLGSLGLAVGNGWLLAKSLTEKEPHPSAMPVVKVGEVPVGGSKLFRYPTENDPALLVRLAENEYVAYAQRCTHLSCNVYFDKAEGALLCPCHHGRFEAASGRVEAGPPERPLPRITLELRGDTLYATGVTLS